ncbi:MAG: UDP-N-acetylglucosamine 4,6-dehydratase (inverting) [Lentisphaerae bacterium GWF2_57_35]|nr:MAG: UDP-N-acetylglucosamine 4,6-dehydratase (inverting) [Lentisphaerae bacterium GWF2_57_35]
MLNISNCLSLDQKRILITGGTGSLGRQLAKILVKLNSTTRVIVLSRDEFKQHEMQCWAQANGWNERLTFFLGDVREYDRLRRAFYGVDYVIHTAALKQVPAAEYNPFEFVKTNVMGAQNVINAALDCGVKKVVAISTDKAANPINLYGATKLCSDKLFVAGNSYSGMNGARFSVVRYGNVVGSRGSVVPFFLHERKKGILPITDDRMTRFWITLEQGASLVLNALDRMLGGELFIPRIPSMRISDLARVIAPECRQEVVGIRPGEKLHEVMIAMDDGRQTFQFDNYFVIKPLSSPWREDWSALKGRPCPPDFYYGSDNNTEWLSDEQLTRMIASLDLPEAQKWAKERGR